MNRRGLIVLLLGIEGEKYPGINGITRLQKLLYLLEKEENLKPEQGQEFDFVPYKMGPFSSKLYDDLEMLENLGMIESDPSSNPAEPEIESEELGLTFDELMGSEDSVSTDVTEEKCFRLTEKGKDYLKDLLSQEGAIVLANGIRKVKSRYMNYSLRDLLRYVYSKYPEAATESEIRDSLMKRNRWK